jgi:hypothetical protein
MPDHLKAGIELLSGMDLSDIRVHGNSDNPAQLNALAYAQGNDIHLGPRQERYLPHEAWHLVQQRQSRVKPTLPQSMHDRRELRQPTTWQAACCQSKNINHSTRVCEQAARVERGEIRGEALGKSLPHGPNPMETDLPHGATELTLPNWALSRKKTT